jgi:hypothetical protein
VTRYFTYSTLNKIADNNRDPIFYKNTPSIFQKKNLFSSVWVRSPLPKQSAAAGRRKRKVQSAFPLAEALRSSVSLEIPRPMCGRTLGPRYSPVRRTRFASVGKPAGPVTGDVRWAATVLAGAFAACVILQSKAHSQG